MTKKVKFNGGDYFPAISAKTRLDNECRLFQAKVMRAVEGAQGTDEFDREVVQSALGIEAGFRIPLMTDSRARISAAGSLYRGMRSLAENNPAFEYAFVTFCDEKWQTSENRPIIEMKDMITTTRNCLRRASPNFIAVGEITALANVRHRHGGRTLSLHSHALVFGPDAIEKAKRMAERDETKFTPPLADFKCIHVKPGVVTTGDFARLAAYMFKPPGHNKTLYKSNDATKKPNLHKSESADRYISYLRQAQVQAQLKLGNAVYASGTGNEIRKEMLARSLKAVRTKSALLPPIHSDELLSHLADMMQRMGRDNYAVPVIKLRP